MSVAMAGSFDGWRFLATSLAVNHLEAGEVVESEVSPERLTSTPAGWVAGTGDARAAALACREVEDPRDPTAVLETLQHAVERAEKHDHDPHQLHRCTRLHAADTEGVAWFSVKGSYQRGDPEDFHYLTRPPDVSEEVRGQLFRQFSDALDPEDPETAILASEAVVNWLAENSDHVGPEFSVGMLQRDGDEWEATRYDCKAGG